MRNRTAKWATAAGAVVVLALGSGCVRIQDVEMLQAEVETLKGELADAQGAAKGAMSEAEAARAAAGDASRAADSAMNTANDAQAGSTANSEKIDRMFEKVMMK